MWRMAQKIMNDESVPYGAKNTKLLYLYTLPVTCSAVFSKNFKNGDITQQHIDIWAQRGGAE